jgi:RHH-type rel operon transcriptional repressor/antitoxin RelB
MDAIHVYQRRSEMLAIRLPSEIEKRLAELAKATGRTKTFYVREAILEYLDDLEDIYLAEKRLGNFYAGKSRAASIEDVERELGLAD